MAPRPGRDDDPVIVEAYLPTTVEVCRTIGATYRQIDYWIRRGLLEPRHAAAGSGTVRRWTPDDVAEAILLRDVIAVLGPSSRQDRSPLSTARDLLAYWRSEGRPSGYLLVFDGGVGHVGDLADAVDLLDLGHGPRDLPHTRQERDTMNDERRYVLRDPEDGRLWYYLGRAPYGVTRVYGVVDDLDHPDDAELELVEGARTGWYRSEIELDEARWVVATSPDILHWRLRDDVSEQTRAILDETLDHETFRETVSVDPEEDDDTARLWRAAYVAVKGEPGEREEIVDLADATVLDGAPAPSLPDGAEWVARLPYELRTHREYLHLFPGRLEGITAAVVAALDAIPGIRAHSHTWSVYAKTHGKTRSLDPAPLRPPPRWIEADTLAEALVEWRRIIAEYVETAERYVRADACSRCGGDGIAWEVDYSIEARAARAAKALAKVYKGKRTITHNAREIARVVLEEVSR